MEAEGIRPGKLMKGVNSLRRKGCACEQCGSGVGKKTMFALHSRTAQALPATAEAGSGDLGSLSSSMGEH